MMGLDLWDLIKKELKMSLINFNDVKLRTANFYKSNDTTTRFVFGCDWHVNT